MWLNTSKRGSQTMALIGAVIVLLMLQRAETLASAGQSGAAGAGDCIHSLETGDILWQDNLTDSFVDVVWGYGEEDTCHTLSGCFGINDTEDQVVDIQLKPIQLQQGVQLR
ncbi:uncharacterized protein LOC593839 [Strongylocentrotus purpuratus]|uniref:Uncharacterized protein n=1 Tax=Strongylocentrotus purpuratus TaxID=7668 RepID=A0A7M7PP82_STRPU|nr:uncharacterized protein LOC593839 [Strongylocentrotus purpuratus]